LGVCNGVRGSGAVEILDVWLGLMTKAELVAILVRRKKVLIMPFMVLW
jgi:hypothetical protein